VIWYTIAIYLFMFLYVFRPWNDFTVYTQVIYLFIMRKLQAEWCLISMKEKVGNCVSLSVWRDRCLTWCCSNGAFLLWFYFVSGLYVYFWFAVRWYVCHVRNVRSWARYFQMLSYIQWWQWCLIVSQIAISFSRFENVNVKRNNEAIVSLCNALFSSICYAVDAALILW